MATQPVSYLTPEQYLELERGAERRSEYIDGRMFAMAGANEAHNLVVANTLSAIHQQLRTRPCRVYSTDMRVRSRTQGPYMYPDLAAVCGAPEFANNEFDTLLNPVLVIEVLSPSTEAYDRGRKFEAYKKIETLREYLLIAADRMHADLYIRQSEGRWLLTSVGQPADVLTLGAVSVELRLADLYEKVELSSSSADSEPAAQ